MAPYVYKRLRKPENGNEEFRLVTLHRGAPEADIRVSIHTHPMPGGRQADLQKPSDVPSWQALSYIWGDISDVENITVFESDMEEVFELNVTKSLAEAIRHLRYSNRERLMWIDAICIDQADDAIVLAERAWQVRSMHHIYTQADGVVLWLGPEADDSNYALQILHDLGSSVAVNWWTFEIITDEGRPTEAMNKFERSTYASREQRAIAALIDRPYFDRVWVKQEAILCKESMSRVLVGKRSISLDVFRKGAHCMSLIGLDARSPNMEHEKDQMIQLRYICQREYNDEPNLMARTRTSTCKDDRDRVYGNIGLMTIHGHSKLAESIEIDYSQANTVEKTYQSFFKRHQECYNTLRLLMDAGLCQSTNMRPTWVPDWRFEVHAKLDLTMESAASQFLAAECRYHDDRFLEVKAGHASTVSDVRHLARGVEVSLEWYKELASLLRDKIFRDDIAGGIESFARAIVVVLYNPGWSMEVIQRDIPRVRAYLRLLYEAVVNGESVHFPQNHMDEGTATRFETCIRWFKVTRCPFIFSADGYIGVGPLGSQIGDEIFAVLGCRSLMLLRPNPNRSSYQVVGPCFMHSFNWGEALLGPLPNGYTIISRFQPWRSGYLPHYINLNIGTESMWDPRIEWRELEPHPPMVNFMLMPVPPGGPLRIMPDSEYLRRHGIEVQTLMLE